jgi:hypothetical protein
MINLLADALAPQNTFDYIQWGGIVGILLFFIVALQRKWIVMGWQYRAIEQSNVRWMELALRSTNLAESLDKLRDKQSLDQL